MAYRQIRLSDVSGVELNDADAVEVTHKVAGRKFDCSAEEVKLFKPVTNVVELELRYASGQVSTVLVSKTEFSKLIPDEKLESFDSSRGRRSGFSPRNNGAPVVSE